MKSTPPAKRHEFQGLRRARWVVFLAAACLVFIAEAYNYFGLGLSVSAVLVNSAIGLLIAFLMTHLGFHYFSQLQDDLSRAIVNLEAAETQLHWQSAALASAANAIVITDDNGRITWINPAFTQLTGYLPDEVIGQTPNILKSGQHDDAFYAQMWQTIMGGSVWQGELVNRRKDGSLYTEEQTITPVLNEKGQISRYIAMKQDVTRRKAIQDADREQRILAESLREAGLALSATLDLDEVMDILLDQIGRVVPYDTMSLLRVGNGRAVVVRTRERDPLLDQAAKAENTVFIIEETPNLSQLIQFKQPVIIPDTAKYPGWITIEAGAHIRSWIGVPIIVEGEIYVLLSLDKQEPNFYLPKHARILSAFAVQASLVLHNAQLFAEKGENLRREQQVSQVVQATNATLDLPHVLKQVVELAAGLVDADGAALALVSTDGQMMTYPYLFNMPEALEWRPVPEGRGLAWRVTKTRQAIMEHAYADHPDALTEWIAAGVQAFLFVPIVAGDTCLGALGLFYFSQENIFSERDRSSAELVGRQVGVAIQNARLFEETRQRARELDLLNRIIAATAVSQNETEMLQIGCVELARYFGVPQTVCALLDETRENVRIIAESLSDELSSIKNRHVPVKGNPVLQRFFDNGVAVALSDISHLSLPPEMKSVLTDRGINSILMVPIALREQIIGVIGVHSQKTREFSDSDIHLAVTVGEEIGRSLETIRLNDQMRLHAAELEKRVAERTQELAGANEQLQQLDRLKSKFVSDVSHELRTPITNLTMYLDLLERGRADRREHYVSVLQKETARIRQLVEDILDLSRLEASRDQGGMFKPVDLNEIVSQVVTAQLPQINAAGLRLRFLPDTDLPLILAAPHQLTQVVTNLLTNAVNYTPEGSIEVKTYQENDEVCLMLQDTGMGIDPDDMPHLFERFYRGQRVAQLGVPGTGLGLGIVKEIVDLHGGRVEAASEFGKGSVFRVWLRTIGVENEA
ncbi:MAG: GAF domain-containing protein [Ardenticatenaceae bacterium]|nr:GAF domain-containing protein [Ardenticatenaceae bacterium]MCB9444702.1 GAF domain-containing protein [Ardenticatenaceae bacterium]